MMKTIMITAVLTLGHSRMIGSSISPSAFS